MSLFRDWFLVLNLAQPPRCRRTRQHNKQECEVYAGSASLTLPLGLSSLQPTAAAHRASTSLARHANPTHLLRLKGALNARSSQLTPRAGSTLHAAPTTAVATPSPLPLSSVLPTPPVLLIKVRRRRTLMQQHATALRATVRNHLTLPTRRSRSSSARVALPELYRYVWPARLHLLQYSSLSSLYPLSSLSSLSSLSPLSSISSLSCAHFPLTHAVSGPAFF